MAESTVFERVARTLEESTRFNRLQARGTLRLVLKQTGLSPSTVTPEEMSVVIGLPLFEEALVRRGVQCSPVLAAQLTSVAETSVADEPRVESVKDIFARFA